MSYAWSNNAVTANIADLTAGWYKLTVTDENLCILVDSIEVTQPELLTVTLDPTMVTCNGADNASIIAVVNGGTMAYSYTWSNAETTEMISGLDPAEYSVAITDANGCTANASVTITEPEVLAVTLDASAILCNGGTTDVTTVVTGGTAPYSYMWTGAEISESLTEVIVGTYAVTITDANNCTVNASIEITQPDALGITMDGTNLTCFESQNGAASATVTGGTGTYTYVWSNLAETESISDVAAGWYYVTVSDVNACSIIDSIEITQPEELMLALSSTNISCNGLTDGTASVVVTGGTGLYSYLWSNTETTSTITGLSAATYTLEVIDENNCTATGSVEITEPAAIVVGITANQILCNGEQVALTATVVGGTEPYSYLWDGGAITEEITGGAGAYSVTVTDAGNCIAENTISLTEPDAIVVTPTITNASCFGYGDGAITIEITGGTGTAYGIVWSNNETTATISNLISDTYHVTVTDENNCAKVESFVVAEPDAITITGIVTDVTTAGGNDGAIDITSTGGDATYSYAWSNTEVTEDLTGLTAGYYSVVVTDGNSCTGSYTGLVMQPNDPSCTLTIEASTVQNVLCNGAANGIAAVVVTNEYLPPYTYYWEDANSNFVSDNDTAYGLTPGQYSVVVMNDDLSCMVMGTAAITEPVALEIQLAATNVSCNGLSDGEIVATISGGTADYSLEWSTLETTTTISNLTVGTYSLTVTDDNDCIATATIDITEPNALTLALDATNITCNGNADGYVATTVEGGTMPYTYAWSNSTYDVFANNLPVGVITLTVTDANNCEVVGSVDITQPEVLTVAISEVAAILCNGGTADLVTNVAGGTAPYTYSWIGGEDTESLTSVVAGTYDLTITDANACVANTSFNLTEPAAISATAVIEPVSCNAGINGEIALTISGGTAPLNVLWSNDATTEIITGLAVGTYTAAITDANGCSIVESYVVTEPEVVAITGVSTNVSVFGLSDGAIDITVTGGNLNYTYVWSNAETTEDVTTLAAGVYSVTATDGNSCEATASFLITQPSDLSCDLAIATSTISNVSCNGLNDGSVDVQITADSNPVTPYSYFWTDADNNFVADAATVASLSAGTYNVVVMNDDMSCTVYGTATVTQPDLLTAVLSATPATCFGLADGSANAVVSGGITDYSYAWSNSIATANNDDVAAGWYVLTVIDNNNCTLVDSVEVAQPEQIVLALNAVNLTCSGNNTGAASVAVISGGVPTISFEWSNTETTDVISNLAAGMYTVTATDANSCTSVDSVEVIDGVVISATIVGENISCFGLTDGAADLTINGGTSPYSILWSNTETTEDITGLAAGWYSVAILDVNNCAVIDSVQITEPSAIAIDTVTVPASSGSAADGEINLTVSGGTSPYDYVWSNTATTEDLTGLVTGTYDVTVTDLNGCQSSISVFVDFVDAISATLAEELGVSFYPNPTSSVLNITCNNDAAIVITDVTGKVVYNSEMNSSILSVDVRNFADGTYFLKVVSGNKVVNSKLIVKK